MSITFQCPRCRKPLKVPDDYAGRNCKCTGCSATLTVPPASHADDANPFGFSSSQQMIGSVAGRSVGSAATEEDNDDSPARLHLRQAYGWQSVAGGLNQIWLGTCVQVLSATVVFLMMVALLLTGAKFLERINEGVDSPVDPRGAVGVAGLAGVGCVAILVLIGLGLRLVGFFRCLGTPKASGTRGLAFMAVGCELATLGGTLLSSVGGYLYPVLGWIGNIVGLTASLGGVVFLLLFLHKVGLAVGSRQLPARVRHFATWFVGGLMGLVLLSGVSYGMIVAHKILSALIVLSFPGVLLFFVTLIGIPLTIFMKYLGTIAIASDELKKRTGRWWA